MLEFYCVQINSQISVEKAWEELEEAGASIAYSEENEEHQALLFVYVPSSSFFNSFHWIESYVPYQLPEINWEEQWEIHGLDFEEGLVHVNLEQFGGPPTTLYLQPGPGFGDVSHPTTRLVLSLMATYSKKQTLIDIGCGSGILTVAGLAMGSSEAYGIDIDSEALKHSEKNAELNQMNDKCVFILPKEFKIPKTNNGWLIVMNMIHTEQQEAWNSLPTLNSVEGLILTSGITREDREIYLDLATSWGWQLQEEIEEANWLAFCFKKS